eukprot:CAMPEP_0119378848 /NCGR_PEP_ID=MMETSP1334-20130426/50260_1 /TAXON_ID=127549 /ORGANISM="Calcidiscus leptoporus, Strain RCC1130" /LENGTH=125 /DNA_ID=CAMNT_0007398193 /DNA_START=218 /DNA_END=595 /DNA_ORIENTATION=-
MRVWLVCADGAALDHYWRTPAPHVNTVLSPNNANHGCRRPRDTKGTKQGDDADAPLRVLQCSAVHCTALSPVLKAVAGACHRRPTPPCSTPRSVAFAARARTNSAAAAAAACAPRFAATRAEHGA